MLFQCISASKQYQESRGRSKGPTILTSNGTQLRGGGKNSLSSSATPNISPTLFILNTAIQQGSLPVTHYISKTPLVALNVHHTLNPLIGHLIGGCCPWARPRSQRIFPGVARRAGGHRMAELIGVSNGTCGRADFF